MNLLGIDVRTWDVPAFIAGARVAFVVVAVVMVALAVRWRRPVLLLALVALGNAWVWAVTNLPLQRPYGLGVSHDRLGNLALALVVAAGNSPLRTAQVGQLHFEPFWGLFVSVLSGFSPDRALALYPWLALVIAVGAALSIHAALRPLPDGPADAWSGWERALVAGAVTLLCASPLDFAEPYRVSWARMFLLKPNHALGLVLFPLVLAAFARVRTWPQRLAVGVLLHLLGWVFVLHMAYVSIGLAVFAALSGWGPDRRRAITDVAGVLLVNAIVVSPYLVMLLVGYPFMDRNPEMVIDTSSPHLLEVTAHVWPVFLLAAWGTVVAWRRDRLGRVWAAQLLAALAIWAGYLYLSHLQQARERDEIDYWCRLLLAAMAAVGAWDLSGRLVRLEVAGIGSWRWHEPARAALLCALALPVALPVWWDPARMDGYFNGCLAPMPDVLTRLGDHLRHRTPADAVVAGDREMAAWVSGLGARRVLLSNALHMPKDYARRMAIQEALVRRTDAATVQEVRARYGVRYLLVTPALLAEHPGTTLEDLDARPTLARDLYLKSGRGGREWIALFRLVEPGGVP